jgi:hypothetical protein
MLQPHKILFVTVQHLFICRCLHEERNIIAVNYGDEKWDLSGNHTKENFMLEAEPQRDNLFKPVMSISLKQTS